jgi:hypothetical protein
VIEIVVTDSEGVVYLNTIYGSRLYEAHYQISGQQWKERSYMNLNMPAV